MDEISTTGDVHIHVHEKDNSNFSEVLYVPEYDSQSHLELLKGHKNMQIKLLFSWDRSLDIPFCYNRLSNQT